MLIEYRKIRLKKIVIFEHYKKIKLQNPFEYSLENLFLLKPKSFSSKSIQIYALP